MALFILDEIPTRKLSTDFKKRAKSHAWKQARITYGSCRMWHMPDVIAVRQIADAVEKAYRKAG